MYRLGSIDYPVDLKKYAETFIGKLYKDLASAYPQTVRVVLINKIPHAITMDHCSTRINIGLRVKAAVPTDEEGLSIFGGDLWRSVMRGEDGVVESVEYIG
jgi:hypothetical protein